MKKKETPPKIKSKSGIKRLIKDLMKDQGLTLEDLGGSGGLHYKIVNGSGAVVGSLNLSENQLANNDNYFKGIVLEQLDAAAREPVNRA